MLVCDIDIIGIRFMYIFLNILYICYYIEKYMFRSVFFVEEEIYLFMYIIVGKLEVYGI